jgi:hypothetical protein
MTKNQYHHATGIFSTRLAIASFALGTLILILFLYTKNFQVAFAGFIYLILAVIINLIVLFRLIYLLVTQTNHQEYYTIKILILLANVPIALVYARIATQAL